MSCSVTDPLGCVGQAVHDAGNNFFAEFASGICEAITYVLETSVSWWALDPTGDLSSTPTAQIQQWLLPFTVLVVVMGLMYNAGKMILQAKPEPLINSIRGLWNAALWGAISITGTQAMITAGDQISVYFINQGIATGTTSVSGGFLAKMTLLIVPNPAIVTAAPFLVMIVGILVLLASFIQALLMLFRFGSIIILTGALQLAAAGTVTDKTQGWLRKVLSWWLTLLTYKPIAALIYAIAFILVHNGTQTPKDLFMGIAMMFISLIAMPVLLKFFNWTVGEAQHGGNSVGLVAAGAASALHAASSLRGSGRDDQSSGGGGVAGQLRAIDSGLGTGAGKTGPSSPSLPSAGSGGPSGSTAATTPRFLGTSTAGAGAAGAAAGPHGAIATAGMKTAAGGITAAGNAATRAVDDPTT